MNCTVLYCECLVKDTIRRGCRHGRQKHQHLNNLSLFLLDKFVSYRHTYTQLKVQRLVRAHRYKHTHTTHCYTNTYIESLYTFCIIYIIYIYSLGGRYYKQVLCTLCFWHILKIPRISLVTLKDVPGARKIKIKMIRKRQQ